MQNRTYYLLVATLTVILMGAAYYPATIWLKPGSLPFILVAIGISGISGIIAYAIVSSGIETRIQMFTAFIMGSMLAKMMVGIMSVLIVALKFYDFAMEYVLSYFFCYIIFTGFEVYALLRKLRPISKNGTGSTQNENASN